MARRRKKSPLRAFKRRLSGLMAIVVAGLLALQFASRADEADTSIQCPDNISAQSLLYVKTNTDLAAVDVDYGAFAVNFNPVMHQPNWVAWELTADETSGPVKRHSKFAPDPQVDGCAETWDYSYSGYDRGHMAPAGDMKWSAEAMKNTFYLTNICPQAKSLNTGAWKRLEEKCRQWAKADSSLIIICGPVLTDSIREFIGDSRVAVPQRFFKVILSPNAKPMRGIGFVMNNGTVAGGIQKAATSIRQVEAITGHDFFSALPDSIENSVETQNDFHFWSTIK
jgi:endonuclease G